MQSKEFIFTSTSNNDTNTADKSNTGVAFSFLSVESTDKTTPQSIASSNSTASPFTSIASTTESQPFSFSFSSSVTSSNTSSVSESPSTSVFSFSDSFSAASLTPTQAVSPLKEPAVSSLFEDLAQAVLPGNTKKPLTPGKGKKTTKKSPFKAEKEEKSPSTLVVDNLLNSAFDKNKTALELEMEALEEGKAYIPGSERSPLILDVQTRLNMPLLDPFLDNADTIEWKDTTSDYTKLISTSSNNTNNFNTTNNNTTNNNAAPLLDVDSLPRDGKKKKENETQEKNPNIKSQPINASSFVPSEEVLFFAQMLRERPVYEFVQYCVDLKSQMNPTALKLDQLRQLKQYLEQLHFNERMAFPGWDLSQITERQMNEIEIVDQLIDGEESEKVVAEFSALGLSSTKAKTRKEEEEKPTTLSNAEIKEPSAAFVEKTLGASETNSGSSSPRANVGFQLTPLLNNPFAQGDSVTPFQATPFGFAQTPPSNVSGQFPQGFGFGMSFGSTTNARNNQTSESNDIINYHQFEFLKSFEFLTNLRYFHFVQLSREYNFSIFSLCFILLCTLFPHLSLLVL